MPESTNPKPIPENYRRIEGSERRSRPGEQWVRRADANQTLPVIIRVKASAGQSGLDRIAAFAIAQGFEVAGRSDRERILVVSGTVARFSEVFAIEIGVHESPAGTCRGFTGHLHLPSGLAEIVDHVLGLIEGEIGNIEKVIANLGGTADNEGIGKPVMFDLIVPPSGPSGAVNPDEFSMVQVFDVGWLLDPGYQRMLDNLAASPVAFKTVRVMKVFTSGGTPETGIEGTAAGGTVWPAGLPSSSIDFTVTLNALAELTSRGLIPFIVLSFFPDGIYNGTSLEGSSSLPMPAGPSSIDDGTFAADMTTIFGNWKTLVQAFLAALTGDTVRFGAAAIANWWFEVWNEPDDQVGSLWGPDAGTDTLTYYQQLYQYTSQAVTEGGYKIRLGGPTITGPSVIGTNTTIPGLTATLMSGFIDFVQTNSLQCDFLSFHAKGSWSNCLNGAAISVVHGDQLVPVVNGGPSLQSAIDAADQTAFFAKNAGLTPIIVINDEADMRLYSDIPFRPRMTEQFPAWLTAMTIAYDSLSSEYAPTRCRLGSDNAELQLVGYTQAQGPVGGPPGPEPSFALTSFGQQRTIMTAASSLDSGTGTCPIDLLKVPVYNFYELLRLLGDQHGVFLTGANEYYPHNSDLFHMISWAATHIGSVFCVYPPNPPGGAATSPRTFNYSIVGITWNKINWYQFQIDPTHSNGFNAAGGSASEPVVSTCAPDSRAFPATSIPLPLTLSTVQAIRSAQDLSVIAAQRDASPDFNVAVNIPAYTTTIFWITEYNAADAPATPVWETTAPYALDTAPYGTNVVLSWQPSTEPQFYSWEVYRDEQTNRISPDPLGPPPATTLRAAFWVDTAPGSGSHTYWIRAVSASGNFSGYSAMQVVSVP